MESKNLIIFIVYSQRWVQLWGSEGNNINLPLCCCT